MSRLRKAADAAVREVETELIKEALQLEDGNVTHAAARLGISRKGLQLKMVEYGLRERWWQRLCPIR